MMYKKKKIYIGSFGVAILILMASFSMVIGEQINKETTANSPLFAFRIQNTINGEQKSVTSYYLGKGKECKISVISKDIKMDLLQKIIEKINKMTDGQLAELAFIIYSKKIVKENTQQILLLLHQLKNTPIEAKKQLSSIPNDCSHITRGCTPTTFPVCTPTIDYWFLGCVLVWVYVILDNIFFFIIYILEGG